MTPRASEPQTLTTLKIRKKKQQTDLKFKVHMRNANLLPTDAQNKK